MGQQIALSLVGIHTGGGGGGGGGGLGIASTYINKAVQDVMVLITAVTSTISIRVATSTGNITTITKTSTAIASNSASKANPQQPGDDQRWYPCHAWEPPPAMTF